MSQLLRNTPEQIICWPVASCPLLGKLVYVHTDRFRKLSINFVCSWWAVQTYSRVVLYFLSWVMTENWNSPWLVICWMIECSAYYLYIMGNRYHMNSSTIIHHLHKLLEENLPLFSFFVWPRVSLWSFLNHFLYLFWGEIHIQLAAYSFEFFTCDIWCMIDID